MRACPKPLYSPKPLTMENLMENYGIYIEWIGYLGSIIVAVSLMMSSIVKLRWYNLVGASIFSAYGFIIGAMPVALLNLFISLTNIYYLSKMSSQKDFLKLLQIRPENRYMDFFLDFYSEEINKYFPGFYESFKQHIHAHKDSLFFLILRNAAVAGIFMGRRINEQELFVDIDFVIPEYRDMKPGKYIYNQNETFFHNLGIQKLSTYPKQKKHYEYLKKMGFSEEIREGNKVYLVKNIQA